jgi:hypothetical protein
VQLKATATIREDDEGIHVDVTWSGVELDRPSTGGFGLKKTHRQLAERLKRAIDAGAVYPVATVARDVNQKTYVRADSKVGGRHLNADLRRLGY